jgi:DNA-binding transcriptional LysR family regulator
MDSRKLLYVAAIIEQGSITKAAQLLQMTQPALSKTVDRLEAELGVKLLERNSQGIIPTAFGTLLYSHARSIRTELHSAANEIHNFLKQDVTTLTIGTLPSIASSIIAEAVCKWREVHPNVILRIIEKVHVELMIGLIRGEYDFVIGRAEGGELSRDLKRRVLFRDRLHIIARKAHPLFEKSKIYRADLAEYPWIFPTVGSRHRTVLEQFLRAGDVAPLRPRIECGSTDFLKSIVSKSDHLSLLPAYALISETALGTVKPLPLTFSSLNRDIAVVFREHFPLSESSQDLVSHIEGIGKHTARSATL